MSDHSNEVWKTIPEWNGIYEASSFGRIRRVKPYRTTKVGHVMTPCLDKNGYLYVHLKRNGKGCNCKIHRLVASAFLGICQKGKQVNHKNGDKSDSRAENLEYVTPKQNSDHAWRTGLNKNHGEGNGNSKLTEKQVRAIRRIGRSRTTVDLAREYGVSNVLIGLIIRKKIWRRVV